MDAKVIHLVNEAAAVCRDVCGRRETGTARDDDTVVVPEHRR